jgi:protein-arginine kinase activator protein McsA
MGNNRNASNASNTSNDNKPEKPVVEETGTEEELSADEAEKIFDDMIKIKPKGCTNCDEDSYVEIPKVWKDNFVGKGWEVI